jgi:DNA-binding NarL/FixJ family response regulator
MISILLIEDHLLVRESWKEVLGKVNDFQIVAESDNQDDAFEKIQKFRPNVILLDINLKGVASVDLIKKIVDTMPHPKIIVVSMNIEYFFIKKMFTYGIKGYVTKYSPKDDLIDAIYKVQGGETYFCSEVRKLFLDSKQEEVKLSYKELEILKLISKGMGNKQIAAHWNVSVKAVESHKTKIYKKLRLSSIAELISYGKSRGMDI